MTAERWARTLACAAIAGLCGACSSTHLIFATYTKAGVDVTLTDGAPTQLVFGYKRFEGAIVPGIMSQGLLASMIHRWAPGSTIHKIDTVFRGTLLVDTEITMTGAVTDTDDHARTAEIDLTITAADGRTGVIGTAVVSFPE